MKKLALTLLTLTHLAQASVQAPGNQAPVNALDAIMDAPRTVKFYNLAPKHYAGIAAATAVATAIGYISFLGIANGLGYGVQAKFFEPLKKVYTGIDVTYKVRWNWTWVETLGALTGGATGAYYSYIACMPQSGWQEKDREVLDIVLTTTDETSLLAAIDLCFVNSQFGRSSAFAHLVGLSTKLKNTKDIFTRVDKNSFAPAIAAIDTNIAALNQAILAIKNQPSWLDESRAVALSHMAVTQRENHNAQLLGSAVYLANR